MNKIKAYFKGFTKRDYVRYFYHMFLVILGSFLLAFGTGAFLVPYNIVTGGLSGLGIIIQHAVGEETLVVDIVIMIANWVLFFIGLIFLGKKFSLQTLLSVIVYPLALSFILRVLKPENWIQFENVASATSSYDSRLTTLLASVCGSVFVGLGCAITFRGGGSTGGFDVIAFIGQKYLKIKCSVGTFLIDASIILIGLFVLKDISGVIIGIIGAFIVALIIDKVFIGASGSYIAFIVTDKYQEITDCIVKEIDRSTTTLDVVGGYSQEKKKMVKIVFSRKEYTKILEIISKYDTKAFVSITKAHEINGEGFSPLKKNRRNKK